MIFELVHPILNLVLVVSDAPPRCTPIHVATVIPHDDK